LGQKARDSGLPERRRVLTHLPVVTSHILTVSSSEPAGKALSKINGDFLETLDRVQLDIILTLHSRLAPKVSTCKLRIHCEITAMLAPCAHVFMVSSLEKPFNAYSRCSLCPMLPYLGYVSGPGYLSLLVFVPYPQLLKN